MHVMLPKLNEAQTGFNLWKPIKENDHMIPRFQANIKDNMTYLINNPPKWNPGTPYQKYH